MSINTPRSLCALPAASTTDPDHVSNPDRVPVGVHEPVLHRPAAAPALAVAGPLHHPVSIVGVEALDPEVRVGRPLLDREVEELLDPLAHERVAPVADVALPDHRLDAGEQVAETLLALDQRLLGRLALADVVAQPDREPWDSRLVAGDRDMHVGRHRAPVLPPVLLLDPIALALASDELREERVVLGRALGERDVAPVQLRELLARVAEHLLEGVIRLCEPPGHRIVVGRQRDPDRGRVEQHPEPALRELGPSPQPIDLRHEQRETKDEEGREQRGAERHHQRLDVPRERVERESAEGGDSRGGDECEPAPRRPRRGVPRLAEAPHRGVESRGAEEQERPEPCGVHQQLRRGCPSDIRDVPNEHRAEGADQESVGRCEASRGEHESAEQAEHEDVAHRVRERSRSAS
jgi:hypothetical protein